MSARPIPTLELLVNQAVRDVIEARTAVLFGEIGAKNAQLGHLGDDLTRKLAFDVRLSNDGDDLVIYEAAHAVANRALFFGELAVDVVEVEHRREQVMEQRTAAADGCK